MSLYYSCLPSISTLPFTQRLDTPPAYNAMISDIPCMAIPVMLSSRIPSFAIRTSPPLLSMVVPSQVLPLVRIHPVTGANPYLFPARRYVKMTSPPASSVFFRETSSSLPSYVTLSPSDRLVLVTTS